MGSDGIMLKVNEFDFTGREDRENSITKPGAVGCGFRTDYAWPKSLFINDRQKALKRAAKMQDYLCLSLMDEDWRYLETVGIRLRIIYYRQYYENFNEICLFYFH